MMIVPLAANCVPAAASAIMTSGSGARALHRRRTACCMRFGKATAESRHTDAARSAAARESLLSIYAARSLNAGDNSTWTICAKNRTSQSPLFTGAGDRTQNSAWNAPLAPASKRSQRPFWGADCNVHAKEPTWIGEVLFHEARLTGHCPSSSQRAQPFRPRCISRSYSSSRCIAGCHQRGIQKQHRWCIRPTSFP